MTWDSTEKCNCTDIQPQKFYFVGIHDIFNWQVKWPNTGHCFSKNAASAASPKPQATNKILVIQSFFWQWWQVTASYCFEWLINTWLINTLHEYCSDLMSVNTYNRAVSKPWHRSELDHNFTSWSRHCPPPKTMCRSGFRGRPLLGTWRGHSGRCLQWCSQEELQCMEDLEETTNHWVKKRMNTISSVSFSKSWSLSIGHVIYKSASSFTVELTSNRSCKTVVSDTVFFFLS